MSGWPSARMVPDRLRECPSRSSGSHPPHHPPPRTWSPITLNPGFVQLPEPWIASEDLCRHQGHNPTSSSSWWLLSAPSPYLARISSALRRSPTVVLPPAPSAISSSNRIRSSKDWRSACRIRDGGRPAPGCRPPPAPRPRRVAGEPKVSPMISPRSSGSSFVNHRQLRHS